MNKFALFALFSLLLGCASPPGLEPSLSSWEPISPSKYIQLTYEATDSLATQLVRYTDFPYKNEPILVATLVSVDELESASRLGRSISEQVAARLTQHGFKVVEVKLRGSLFVKRAEGELLLSREIAKISQAYQAPAVVVGTYAPATNFVHINLKVVKANTQVVLAAADYGLPLDANTRALLHSGK